MNTTDIRTKDQGGAIMAIKEPTLLRLTCKRKAKLKELAELKDTTMTAIVESLIDQAWVSYTKDPLGYPEVRLGSDFLEGHP